jgi:hypothetical protein
MDYNLYREEGFRQLNNPKYYLPIENSCTNNIIPTINAIITEIYQLGFISPEQYEFLTVLPSDNFRKFYLLPKIHKEPSTWPHPNMPAGRPIVSDCNSPTYHISKYIDYFLQPLGTTHPSHIKDTYHFINQIQSTGKEIPPNSILVSGDITSLYTNMHHHLIIDTIKKQFKLHPNHHRPDKQILRLLLLLLKNNDFQFEGKLYKQILGAAMGFPFSPSAANIYLLDFDEYITSGFRILPTLYHRFLDDQFILWSGSSEDLNEFHHNINLLIPDIKVTFSIQRYSIPFLDTIIYKHPNNDHTMSLKSKIYFKPTDTHQLLHSTSYHPLHSFDSILKSQCIRFKRISSTFYHYESTCHTLFHTLKYRGYSFSKFRKIKREVYNNYTTSRPTKSKNIFPIVTYYDPISIRINKYIKQTLSHNPAFSNTRLLAAYKNHPAIKSKFK